MVWLDFRVQKRLPGTRDIWGHRDAVALCRVWALVLYSCLHLMGTDGAPAKCRVVETQPDSAGRAWLQVAAGPGGNVGLGGGGRATVNLSAQPRTGPPGVPGEPPLSSSVFSVFPGSISNVL